MISKTIAATLLFSCFASTALALQVNDPFAPLLPRTQVARAADQEEPAKKSDKDAAADDASAEEKINAALSEKTSLDFFEQPLDDVVVFLRDNHGINAQLDMAGMDLAGVAPEDTVTISLSGISLHSALRLVLKELGLTYVIRDEVLQITSVEAAEKTTTTEIHDISTILNTYNGDLEEDFPQMLRNIIAPKSWAPQGKNATGDGIGDVVAMNFGNERYLLIVTQTRANHEAIENLIEELRNKVKEGTE